jgi:hypothetical protein
MLGVLYYIQSTVEQLLCTYNGQLFLLDIYHLVISCRPSESDG